MEAQKKDDIFMQEREGGELRTRRVGSVTFGLTLILFGVLFLIHIVAPSLNYEIIFSLWPVVFVLLGVEILIENHRSKTRQCKFVYDFPAILMLVMMLLFAMVMAGVDYAMHYPDIWW